MIFQTRNVACSQGGTLKDIVKVSDFVSGHFESLKCAKKKILNVSKSVSRHFKNLQMPKMWGWAG